MRSTGPIAGLYGKLPGQGDFLNRGIPRAVEDAWTRWLDGCLGEAKAALDSYWLPTYLSSPPWRFALDPNLVGPSALVGVIASSVDKVGRAYPLTGFLGLGPQVTLDDLDGSSEHPFVDLETILLEAIDGAIDSDMAGARIAALTPQLRTLTEADDRRLLRSPRPMDSTLVLLGHGAPSIAAMVGTATRRLDAGEGAGWSCWWQNGWAGMAPMALVSRGLPPAHAFLGFLDGQWAEHGWVTATGAPLR